MKRKEEARESHTELQTFPTFPPSNDSYLQSCSPQTGPLSPAPSPLKHPSQQPSSLPPPPPPPPPPLPPKIQSFTSSNIIIKTHPQDPRRTIKLDEDILLSSSSSNILCSFLSPNQLLSFSFSSKNLLSRLTHTQVISSVLLGSLQSKGGSWSRQTLSSIMKLCDAGKIWPPSPKRLLRLCAGKRCENPICGDSKVNIVRPDLGVFLCWNCLTNDYTTGVRTELVRSRCLLPAINHARTASSPYSKICYLLTRDMVVDGERVGPITTMYSIQQYAAAFTTFLDSVPKINPTVIAFYTSTAIESERLVEKQATRDATAKKAAASQKSDKYNVALAAVLTIMGNESAWSQLAAESSYLERRMSAFKSAPSKAKGAALKEVVGDCERRFKESVDSGFLNAAFMVGEGDDLGIVGTKVRSYLKRIGNSALIKASDVVLDLIAEGNLWSAALATYESGQRLSQLFTDDKDPAGKETGNLATQVWHRCLLEKTGAGGNLQSKTRDTLEATYLASSALYDAMLPIAREYLDLSWLDNEKREKEREKDKWWPYGLQHYLLYGIDLVSLEKRDFVSMLERGAMKQFDDCR